MMLHSDSTKQSSSSSERDGAEIIYSKENVAIHPTQIAISGRLKLIKQGSSLFMVIIGCLFRYFLVGCGLLFTRMSFFFSLVDLDTLQRA